MIINVSSSKTSRSDADTENEFIAIEHRKLTIMAEMLALEKEKNALLKEKIGNQKTLISYSGK